MFKILLQCSNCDKKIGLYTKDELYTYLKNKRMNKKRIIKTIKTLINISGVYNDCCKGYIIRLEPIQHDHNISNSSILEALNTDAHKENKGFNYMTDLYNDYSEGWNNEDNYDD